MKRCFIHLFFLYFFRMNSITLAIIQSDIYWENTHQNIASFENQIKSIPAKTDLVLLPEMFLTGFSMEPNPLAESMEGKAVLWMKSLAIEKKMAIAGSLIIKDELTFKNRFIFVDENGEVQYYDKRHLFGYGGEEEQYSKGNTQEIIKWNSWKIAPRICYDLRFPVWNRQASVCDLLIFVANWPHTRIAHWDALLKARAIENQVYTAGVNRIGSDGNGLKYVGHSSCYGYDGTLLGNLGEAAKIQFFELHKDKQQQYRTSFPFLQDGANFNILQ